MECRRCLKLYLDGVDIMYFFFDRNNKNVECHMCLKHPSGAPYD